MHLKTEPPKNIRPEKKGKLVLPGRKIEIEGKTKISLGEIERSLAEIESSLIKKGWCVFHRNGYVGLSGYMANVSNFIPEKNRNEFSHYQNYISKNGEQKTREYLPREEKIVSICKIISVDNLGEKRSKWEVKTLWTVRRNIFPDFENAWEVFIDIEQRYDPGKIVWTQLDAYEYFEPY